MITLSIIGSLILVYLATSVMLFDTPESISNTHYLYSQRFKMGNVVFPTFMALLSFTLLPYWLELAKPHMQCVVFLACGGLLFVGAAACYKEHLTKAVHYTSATVWAIGSIVWLLSEGLIVSVCYGTLLGALGIMCEGKRKAMFYGEVGCVIALYVGLMAKTIIANI